MRTGSSGSLPSSICLRPRSIVCVPGASMQARAIHAFRSVSPIPTMPSSVTTSTTIVSWAELVALRSNPGSSRTWVWTSTTLTSDPAVRAVDRDVRPGHEARLVGAEEDTRSRDLLRPAEAADRMPRQQIRLQLEPAFHGVHHRSVQLGLDHARHESVGADP